MGGEARCVDECPNELKLADASITKGTCRTCTNVDRNRHFFDQMTGKCVKTCL